MKETLLEPRAQRWRAVADIPGGEALLCLGYSIGQVRDAYVDAIRSVLAPEVAHLVRGVYLERFDGAADQGKWTRQLALSRPKVSRAAA